MSYEWKCSAISFIHIIPFLYWQSLLRAGYILNKSKIYLILNKNSWSFYSVNLSSETMKSHTLMWLVRLACKSPGVSMHNTWIIFFRKPTNYFCALVSMVINLYLSYSEWIDEQEVIALVHTLWEILKSR